MLRRAAPAGVALMSALALGAWPPPSPAAPDPQALRYGATQLDCATFHETKRSELQTYVAGRARRETVGLDGEWRFRAAPGPGDSVRLEGWYDSLDVWRRSEQDSLKPDTDPIIGGRFRGLLSADGLYRAEARPYVPDPLLEVADLSRALDDLLPRLPPRVPPVGETWADGTGMEIRRLADSTGAGPVYRLRTTVRRDAAEASLRGDSVPLKLRQSVREDGSFAWDPGKGLLRRDRQITVETYVPAEARVGRPVQARIEQRIVLERVKGGCE